MLFRNLMKKGYLINMKDPESGGGGGGGSDPADPADPAKPADPADPAKPADPADPAKPADPADPAKPAEPKVDPEVAKLVKESMQRKEKIKDLETKLKQFDGIDLEQVNKLLEDARAAETKALEDKGAWDKLKDQLITRHTEETDTLKARIKELEDGQSGKDGVIEKLTVGHSFDSSKFISDDMQMTPSKARIVFGSHFDIVDGQVVAFDKPRGSEGRSQLIDGKGNPMGFDAAMKQIVEADPDRDTLLKSKIKPGADSKPTPAGGKPKPDTSLRGAERIAAGLKAAAAAAKDSQ